MEEEPLLRTRTGKDGIETNLGEMLLKTWLASRLVDDFGFPGLNHEAWESRVGSELLFCPTPVFDFGQVVAIF